MFLLGERDVRKALNLHDCLEINKKALISICQDTGVVPSRLGLPYPNNPKKTKTQSDNDAEDWTLIKPAAYYGSDNPGDISMGMKVVSVRSKNPSNDLPLVPATILLVDPASGMVRATVAGTYVTVARTSAGPALAVQIFRPDTQHLVIFGAGQQAESHICLIELALGRRIPRISIVNRSADRANALKDKFQRNEGMEVILLNDSDAINSVLSQADVIAATTNTKTPLWKDECVVKKGCLITGIGSYTPEMQEIPEYIVSSSHIIIDTPEAMAVGDLKHLGHYPSSTHPITLAGNAFVDPSAIGGTTEYIFYKAVGTAIQDVLTAEAVIESAKKLGIGQEVDMS
jgi:ornithine cyclodeaminase